MQGTRNPDVVIGIDFGMTYTGVAYSTAPDWPPPKPLIRWPGLAYPSIAHKVPTLVARDSSAWGFLCPPHTPSSPSNTPVTSLFKLALSPSYRPPVPTSPTSTTFTTSSPPTASFHPITHTTATAAFPPYICALFSHLTTHFSNTLPRYAHLRVEYLFSVPTTWRHPATIAHFVSLLHAAGFPAESTRVSLTEAEAAAVYAVKEGFRPGEVVVVVDAGGGTTDVDVLKKGGEGVEGLGAAVGAEVGATGVDAGVRRVIEERLRGVVPGGTEGEVAGRMVQGSRFESLKCSFGSAAGEVGVWPLEVPGLGGRDVPECGIREGMLRVSRKELRRVFDGLVEKMFELIDRQLEKLHEAHPSEVISYLVLSGGFGSSPYVQKRLKDRYERGSEKLFPNARQMKILLALEPQLAVCYGLIKHRTQEIKLNRPVYKSRRCRVSYGLLCRVPFDPKVHSPEDKSRDKHDGRMWAENQIDWVIKEGEEIVGDAGVTRRYRKKLEVGKETEPWQGKIIMSTRSANKLPKRLKDKGVINVCQLTATLKREDMKRKNGHWYNTSKTYWLADFEIKILVGHADLSFQLIGASGEVRSKEEGSIIKVEWEPGK